MSICTSGTPFGSASSMAPDQVVDGDNIIAALDQARDSCAPDVSGTSSDGDSHVASRHSRSWAAIQVQDCRIGMTTARAHAQRTDRFI